MSGGRSLTTSRKAIGYPQQDNNTSERFIMAGGLTIQEPLPTGDVGKLLFCQQFECDYDGGYRSKAGWEPVDGRRQPSAYHAVAIQLASITGTPSNKPNASGTIIRGATSGAWGYFIQFTVYAGLDFIVLAVVNPIAITADFKIPGQTNTDLIAFRPGEYLYADPNSSSDTFAQIDVTTTLASIPLLTQNYAALTRQAQAFQMGLIQPVGGSACTGPARGVFDLNGSLYAIRDNYPSGTGASIWQATNTGWQIVPLGFTVYFYGLSADVPLTTNITNGTWSFVVTNVSIQFGTTGTGDAIGFFTTSAITGGTIAAGDTMKMGGVAIATVPTSGPTWYANSLPSGAVTNPPNPLNWRFRKWNFSGIPYGIAGGGQKIYGVNGKRPAFEFDGTVFTQIITGIGINSTQGSYNTISAEEAPTHIAAYSDQLFLGYVGGVLQHSGFQLPLDWTAVNGADTRQVGDDITNLLEDVNAGLLIQTRTRNGMLTGDVSENFVLTWNATTFGAYPFTAARINGAIFVSDEGVMFQGDFTQLGNFQSDTQSRQVASLLQYLMNFGVGVVEGYVSRNRSAYRVVFDGGVVLSFCIVGSDLIGIGYYLMSTRATNFWSEASSIPTGNQNQPGERIFFCNENGFVCQDESGTTLGGAPIIGRLETQFYAGGYSQYLGSMKRYRRMYVEVLGADSDTNLTFSAMYDDGASYRTTENPENVAQNLVGGAYNTQSLYSQTFYGPDAKNVVRKELNNQGVAIALVMSFESYTSLPFVIQAVEIDYAVRSRRGWR